MSNMNKSELQTQLKVLDEQPWNAEPDLSQLIEYEHTPTHLMYARNHGQSDGLAEETKFHSITIS